jgi:heat-inducible transcriptional repressor
MTPPPSFEPVGGELTDRERHVLEAVIRTYVEVAEPTGSRTVARKSELGVSPATVRNTMSDLEEKGYLFHPHTSAGRIPTDRAYRFFVDRLIQPTILSDAEREHLVQEIDTSSTEVERMVRRATRALSLLAMEMGVAIAPRLENAVLERLELVRASSRKVLMVLTLGGGVVRTVYVDLEGEAPEHVLVKVTMVMNERLAGLTLKQIREGLPDRLRDASDDEAAAEILNIFMQSGGDLFDWSGADGGALHLGHASVLASQPEFTSGEQLKGLIQLTEQTDVLSSALRARDHRSGLRVTIGEENHDENLSGFTLVTAEYHMGDLKGVIGVIGPTRMPYEKVIAIVDYTSSLVSRILGP